ncbi:hypothetical protein TNCV_4283971 [Trichonephila clavipes]|nr:hypothetical protein TNCV_4283971 [Trichonephila clavipes]
MRTTPEQAHPSPDFYTPLIGGCLNLVIFKVHWPFLLGKSFVAQIHGMSASDVARRNYRVRFDWWSESPGRANGGILSKSHIQWLGESSNSHGSLQVTRDWTHNDQSFQWLFKALGLLGHDSIFVNECGNNALCFSESQGDFRVG